MSSDSRPVTQGLALRYVVVPRLRQAIIGSVSYLLINNYIVASLTSKTHDYRDKVYYLAGACSLGRGGLGLRSLFLRVQSQAGPPARYPKRWEYRYEQ